jgi:hypothetical protein
MLASRHNILIFGLIVAGLSGGGLFAADKGDDPVAKIEAFCSAIEHADVTAAEKCFAKIDKERDELLREELEVTVAHYRLRKNLAKRFGDSANGLTTPSLVDELRDRLTNSSLRIQDDSASFDDSYTPKQLALRPKNAVFKLRKTPNGWLIDGRDLFGDEMKDTEIQKTRIEVAKITAMVREISDDLDHDKFATAEAVSKAMFVKIVESKSRKEGK